MISTDTLQYLNWTENVAWRCVIAETYFDLTSAQGGRFWPFVQNMLGETVCLHWAHLFGNRNDDLHFSQFFARPDVTVLGANFEFDNVRPRILGSVEMTDDQYLVFWEEVKNCRDQFVAHKEVRSIDTIFPDIKKCRLMAEELRCTLQDVVTEASKKQPSDPKIGVWVNYYRGNSNEAIKKQFKREFETGVVSLGKKLANK